MSEFTKEELKHKLEALLFSSGRSMSVEELSKLMRFKDTKMITESARELMNEYNDRKTSVMMVEESESWKITTREKFQLLVKKIVSQTEMSKTLIETLAVIAYKSPVTQAKIIDIRTNKAYDHIKELERLGFITSTKHSRTKMIKLSQKFFDYFDIDPSKLKDRLGKNEIIEEMIKNKELEIKEKMKKFEGDNSNSENSEADSDVGSEKKLEVSDEEKKNSQIKEINPVQYSNVVPESQEESQESKDEGDELNLEDVEEFD